MPVLLFQGRKLACASGAILRDVLVDAGLSPYNGNARLLHCPGLGSCGTCAVSIRGDVGPLSAMERWRLSFPPHRPERGLRLACQVRVTEDVEVTKHPGFWGHEVADVPGPPPKAPE